MADIIVEPFTRGSQAVSLAASADVIMSHEIDSQIPGLLLSSPQMTKGMGNDLTSAASACSETIAPALVPATPNSVSKELLVPTILNLHAGKARVPSPRASQPTR